MTESGREIPAEAHPRLRWTGHALVDVGIAGVCAFSGRQVPEGVTLEDLDRVSAFIEETYYSGKLGTYLSCVFMNASFVQPNEGAEKKRAFIERYVRAHRAPADAIVANQSCVFSGDPATSPLVRTHFPLFSGEGVMNYRPGGTTWVPAAGAYIVAILMLPMASRRAEGKLLAVHADEAAMTMEFAKRYLEDNRRLLALALPEERLLVHPDYTREIPAWDASKKKYKYADVKGPRSLVVGDLAEIGAEALPTWSRSHFAGLSIYLLSNSGQGPALEIFAVPSGVVSFVFRANDPATRSAWANVARRFKSVRGSGEDEKQGTTRGRTRRSVETSEQGRAGWSKNPAFEELCVIFEAGFVDRNLASAWLRRYLLGRLGTTVVRYDETRARDWQLTYLFLEEILVMKAARIEAIRAFGDKLAKWIADKTDRNLLRSFLYDRPWDLRRRLLRAQQESAAVGPLLFGMDEYTTVWVHEDGDERLVRDLLCIRIIEQLSASRYFEKHPEQSPEVMADAESSQEEAVQ